LAVGASVLNLITKPDHDAPTAGCVIAVDAQGSASTMLDTYRQWIPAQAEDCAAKDHADLSVALISGQTRTETVTPVTGKLSELNYTGNATNDAQIAKAEINRVVADAGERILNAAPASDGLSVKDGGGSDIIGALCVARDLLEGHTPSTLILNTDGVNYRAPYRLTKLPLDDESISKYVDDLKASGVLCNLTGTKVFMYGVGIGKGTNKMSPEVLQGIHRFWAAVIEAAGAELVKYQRQP